MVGTSVKNSRTEKKKTQRNLVFDLRPVFAASPESRGEARRRISRGLCSTAFATGGGGGRFWDRTWGKGGRVQGVIGRKGREAWMW